jgi:hypothetical protein
VTILPGGPAVPPPEPPRRSAFRGAKAHRILAGLLALGAVAGIVALLFTGNPKDYVRGHYREVAHAGGSSYTLVSPYTVSYTASDIRGHWKPAQELVDPSGVFLRYHDLVVAITPRVEGGSTIYLDDERTGYAHWYPYVGGSWGVGSPVSGTRGGGPGSGK